jgi:GNAT superfamily N-acetyltransferase
MSTDDDFEIERLNPADRLQNVALSQSAGWKDVESEWRVLHDAGEVRGIWKHGRVIAHGVLGDYGNSATLAKMVVLPELQRRGLGARLLDEFIALADARRIPVGLCATDLGRPLYRSRNFEVSGELMILFGSASLGPPVGDSVVPLLDAEQAVELDRHFSGCDRSRMLRARCREACAMFVLASGRGFGLASGQGEHALVGPIVADDEEGARSLIVALLGAVARPARIDVPLEHVGLRNWLVTLGLREMSQRVEMARGASRMPWQVAQRFALASQAWG